MIKLIVAPFVLIWKLLTILLVIVGRLILASFAFLMMAAGIVLCFTIIGLALGIPLFILGLLLLIRAIL